MFDFAKRHAQFEQPLAEARWFTVFAAESFIVGIQEV